MPLAKDTLFEISDFNVPHIISGADAWVKIILNLLFLENGTYSDAPDLGLDLKAHTYMESSELVNYVSSELESQVNAYMPQIPLSRTNVVARPMDNGDTILYISLSFITPTVLLFISFIPLELLSLSVTKLTEYVV